MAKKTKTEPMRVVAYARGTGTTDDGRRVTEMTIECDDAQDAEIRAFVFGVQPAKKSKGGRKWTAEERQAFAQRMKKARGKKA